MPSDLGLIFDIPAHLAGKYRDKPVKLRTNDPGAQLNSLNKKGLAFLVSIQIEDLDCDLETLQHSGNRVPLELIVTDPAVDVRKLYAFSSLVESFPIRACISLRPGFEKAVRVAAALHFAIKLEFGQPGTHIIQGAINTLDFYLHSPGVTEPIEFFHSLLLACCHDQAINLWTIQEEDPLKLRYVDERGKESFPGRLAGCSTLPVDPTAHPDCLSCFYRGPCGGYFKWPDHGYDCDGVRELFALIENAAERLRADIATAGAIAP